MAVVELARYADQLNDENSGVHRALAHKFSVSALMESAAKDGLSASNDDWAEYFDGLEVPKTRLQLVRFAEDDIQEISMEELDLVSGGLSSGWAAVWTNAVVAAEGFVNVAVYANAVAVTLVVVAGAAVAVVVAVAV